MKTGIKNTSIFYLYPREMSTFKMQIFSTSVFSIKNRIQCLQKIVDIYGL